jgi:hypothetical protein
VLDQPQFLAQYLLLAVAVLAGLALEDRADQVVVDRARVAQELLVKAIMVPQMALHLMAQEVVAERVLRE